MVTSRSILGSVVVAGLVVASVCCQLAYPLGDLPGLDADVPATTSPEAGVGGEAGTAADASDASDAADAADAADADGGPQLVLSAGFEGDSGSPCAPFFYYMSTPTVSSLAHGGVAACMVCAGAGATNFSLGVTIEYHPVPAGRYVATAWVRSGADTAPVAAKLNLRQYCPTGSAVQNCAMMSSDPTPTTTTYAELATELTVSPEASVDWGNMDVYVSIDNGVDAGDCMIVDDYTVYRE